MGNFCYCGKQKTVRKPFPYQKFSMFFFFCFAVIATEIKFSPKHGSSDRFSFVGDSRKYA